MNFEKVILTFELYGEYHIESIWAEKVADSYYKVKSIPFLAPNIAYNDIIEAEIDEDGILYFYDLISPSGNKVIQIVFFEMSQFNEVTQFLENYKCDWEGSHIPSLISVNIPIEIDYSLIKKYLEEKGRKNYISFKEACIY